MKNRHLKAAVFSLLTAFILVFSACGGGAASSYKKEAAYPTTTAATTYYENYDDAAYEKGSYYDGDREAGKNSAGNKGESSGNSDSIMIDDPSQKLVYTCRITMETTEFSKTTSEVRELVKKYNGFIETDNVSDSDSYWYYDGHRKTSATLVEYVVVRIPASNYTAFLSDIDGQGKIVEKQQQVENITQAYADVETTIASLKTQEKRLLEMMEECESIEEMLAVEDRLSEVQNELKIYESRLKGMTVDVTYSTVTLNIREVLEYSPDVTPDKTSTFGDRLKNTLRDSWEGFLNFCENFLFFLIRALPIILVIGVVVVIIVLVVRKIVLNAQKKPKKDKTHQNAVYVEKAADGKEVEDAEITDSEK